MTTSVKSLRVPGAAGDMAIFIQGDDSAPAIYMTTSILSSSMMWDAQAAMLAQRGWQVIRADTRGHGESQAPIGPYAMDDLVADVVAVLDALRIDRVHYVGLSLGGISGFGLGIDHPDRLLSLCLCDARADAQAAFASPWDERINAARRHGCAALAESTTERWFGTAFLEAHPAIARRFREAVAATSVEGFEGCARALQKFNYLPHVARIVTPTTLVVGANDGPLPQAMQNIQEQIPGAKLEVIAGAGHLPNIDQPDAFNDMLLRHFQRVALEKPY